MYLRQYVIILTIFFKQNSLKHSFNLLFATGRAVYITQLCSKWAFSVISKQMGETALRIVQEFKMEECWCELLMLSYFVFRMKLNIQPTCP